MQITKDNLDTMARIIKRAGLKDQLLFLSPDDKTSLTLFMSESHLYGSSVYRFEYIGDEVQSLQYAGITFHIIFIGQ